MPPTNHVSTIKDSNRIRLLTLSPLTVLFLWSCLPQTIYGALMNDINTSVLTAVIPNLGSSFVQASSDATRRLCEQGQSVTRTVGEWNTEVNHFLTHRVSRNTETITRMTKCQNYPEVFAIQAQWVRDAADDYLKEMSKLFEVNSSIMSGFLGSFGKVESHLSTDTRSPAARATVRGAS
jgi:hypothetical protein